MHSVQSSHLLGPSTPIHPCSAIGNWPTIRTSQVKITGIPILIEVKPDGPYGRCHHHRCRCHGDQHCFSARAARHETRCCLGKNEYCSRIERQVISSCAHALHLLYPKHASPWLLYLGFRNGKTGSAGAVGLPAPVFSASSIPARKICCGKMWSACAVLG